MGLPDLILFPLYTLLFYLLFLWRRKKLHDPILEKYHKHGFWIKVVSSVAFTIFNVYISIGDSTTLYYPEGINITKLILHDFSNIKLLFISGPDFDQAMLADPYNLGYFNSDSNYFVTKVVTLLSFISFKDYMIINLFFSLISFSGVWRLYRFFYEIYPHLHKQLAIAIIYLPTFVFWSSGILKDPLCTGMLGWLTYSLYSIFYKRRHIIKQLLIAFIAAYVIGVVKSYILISYLPFFLLYLLLANISRIERKVLKLAAFVCLIAITIGGFFIAFERLQEEMGALALDKLGETVKNQQTAFINMANQAESSFTLGVEFDGTSTSLLKMAPAAIAATFYRPYLWESKKLSTLLSSLESLALMIFTLYVFLRAGPFTFFKSIITDPMVMFCFFFSLLFGLFVGATTLNFGTLVRYKIPCMPFYVIALVLILQISKTKKATDKTVAVEL